MAVVPPGPRSGAGSGEPLAFDRRVECEIGERVLVRAVLVLRPAGEVVAHRLRGVGRQRPAERGVELADHADLVLHEVGVVHVVHSCRIEGAVRRRGHQTVERVRPHALVVPADLGEVDVVAVRPSQRGDQAGERGEHGERVAVGDREPGVRVDGEERGQRAQVHGRLQHPVHVAEAPLQDLEHEPVRVVRGSHVAALVPLDVRRHVVPGGELLGPEGERHRRQAFLVHAAPVHVDGVELTCDLAGEPQLAVGQWDAGVRRELVRVGAGRRDRPQQLPALGHA